MRRRRNWKARELYSHLLTPEVVMIRLDGRNFSSVLREFEKPYDVKFARVMVDSCKELMREFNAALAYTFSDEVSMLVKDLFGNRLEKIDSIMASELASRVSIRLGRPVGFDCRVICIGTDEVWEYLAWRQDEAWRNHINSYAFYTLLREVGDRKKVHEILKGKKSGEIHDILFKRGINLSKTPAWQRRGILLYWQRVELEKEYMGRVVRYKRRRIVENWEPPLFDSDKGKSLIYKIIKDWII